MLEQARRAAQTVTPDWTPIGGIAVQGVQVKEIRNVVIRSGILTECFRPEWFDSPFQPAHTVYMTLLPGGVSSWHCHRRQRDIIIAVRGQLRIGMYDGRPDSPTYQAGQTFHVAAARPTALLIPPLVWHAIRNPAGGESAYIVLNDEVFNYAEPDDWTLPPGADSIPYKFD